MVSTYQTVLKQGTAEISIEKSRFIGYCAPVSSDEEAQQFIAKIKNMHKDATHNVPAYIIGLNGEIQRYNDDGEPSGTAGLPVLEVLKKEQLRNVVIVVTRYFGGIKLGAGGLVRAYTKGAKAALEAGQIVTKRLYQILQISIDYTLLGKVQNEIIQNGFLIKEIEYDHLVHLYVYVSIERIEYFQGLITDWTNARCDIQEKEQAYLIEKMP